jgi:hypothetical protein
MEGKCGLAVGGGSGIGRASAMRFAEEGARVTVAGRRADKLQETVKLITEIPTHGKMDIFYHAPLVIFVPHRKRDLQLHIEWANAACVVYSMHLEATSLGLGSVFMWGALESARKYPEYDHTDPLNLPDGFEPLIGLAIGHPDMVAPVRKLGINYV